MDGFDTITMNYMGGPMSLQGVPNPNQQLGMPMMAAPLDQFDQRSNYDAETFAGSEDIAYSHHGMGQRPQLKRSYTAYEDPFSDVLSGYEQSTHPEHNGQPPQEPSNKLLSFTQPIIPYALFDFAMRRVAIDMNAQLHGMFFIAESPWATAGDVSLPPTELTCYRRNLFWISGDVHMPRSLQTIVTEHGESIPLMPGVPIELTISANESLEGNPVKIISVPWKTHPGNTAAPEDKVEKEPPSCPLDLSLGQDMDPDYVKIPINWKRLQFRIATANNGRRKELQQHFVVKLKIIATLATGQKVSLCEIQSGAIIVRGRSPRNFQSRKDMPISGGGSSVRKTHLPHQPTRTPTGDTNQTNQTNHSSNAHSGIQSGSTPTTKPMEALHLPFDFNPNDLPVSPDFLDWKMPAGAMTAIPPETPSIQMQSLAPYAQSTPEVTRNQPPRQQSFAQAPVSLSLTDDEPNLKKEPTPSEQMKKRATPARPPSFSLKLINSPGESADLLYEYFPLNLDDWMPPVDAVYRPHVVHHTNLPDPNALAAKNKSKRYFSDAW